ncbi:phosphotransferase family protein [Nocardia sp. NPDC059246]|uniref:phosphotransferase family protein n=1 Tax=unclassified Nocardia TaxID=2637762 RepID=UPI0036C1DADC
MALINRTDSAEVAGKLAASIEKHRPAVSDVAVTDVVIPQSTGMSNDTVVFSAAWLEGGETVHHRLVARVAPTGPSLFISHNLGLEFRVLSALEKSGVPVPAILFHESDESVLGAPFLVMEFVDGKAAPDDPPFTATGWVVDLEPSNRARIADRGLAALASIHNVDWRAVGLGDLDRSGPGRSVLDVVLDDLRDFYEVSSVDLSNPTIEAGLAWLDQHRPATPGEPVLSWGDARFGNLLFTEELEVGAVLDWEMVTVGPRELDLGWWTFLLRHHTDGIGVPLPDGLPTPQESVKRYEEMSGHTVTDFLFYEVIAAVRLSILSQRATKLLIDAGVVPAGSPMLLANPATNLLAELAGLPSPGEKKSSPMNRGA